MFDESVEDEEEEEEELEDGERGEGRGEEFDEDTLGSAELVGSSAFCSDASMNCNRSLGLNFLFVEEEAAGESLEPCESSEGFLKGVEADGYRMEAEVCIAREVLGMGLKSELRMKRDDMMAVQTILDKQVSV